MEKIPLIPTLNVGKKLVTDFKEKAINKGETNNKEQFIAKFVEP